MINREELAWAAGFFDGEGSTYLQRTVEVSNGIEYHYIHMRIGQKERTTLERFQKAVLGLGKISGPQKDGMYRWQASNFERSQAVITMLWTFLSQPKRNQYKLVLVEL